MKKYKKIILCLIIIGIILSFNYLKTYAFNMIDSNSVSYDNTDSNGTKDNVKETIDELYELTEEFKDKCGDYGYVADELDATQKEHVHTDSCYKTYYYYYTKVYDSCPGNSGYQYWDNAAGSYKYTCNKCGQWVPREGASHNVPNARNVSGEGYSLPGGATITSTSSILDCDIEYDEGYVCPDDYSLYQNNKCYACLNGGTLYGKVCVIE